MAARDAVPPQDRIHEQPADRTQETAIEGQARPERKRQGQHPLGFRQDLYYRLNVIQVHLPPLRQRLEDIPLLADHFLRRYAAELDKRVTGLAPDALAALVGHAYPGNVRELENIIERAVTLEASSVVTRSSLPDFGRVPGADDAARVDFPAGGVDLDRVLGDYEREILLRALKHTGGVRKEAARLLGITFRSFRYRLHKLGIETGPDEPDDAA